MVYAGETNVTMSIKELFKGEGEAMSLESFSAIDGIVNIIINKMAVMYMAELIWIEIG